MIKQVRVGVTRVAVVYSVFVSPAVRRRNTLSRWLRNDALSPAQPASAKSSVSAVSNDSKPPATGSGVFVL
jgi:hypothetical protein